MTYEKPQRLRIVEPGWETFTDEMCGVKFVNGLSVEPVASMQARILANVIRMEAEDGTNPSISQALVDVANVEMAVVVELETGVEDPVVEKLIEETANAVHVQIVNRSEQAVAALQGDEQSVVAVVAVPDSVTHTKESLEAIADKEGIKGLREVAARFDVKGRGIEELIKEILTAQSKTASA